MLNCTHRVAGSNSTRLEGFPPGGRCRDDVKLNDASQPCLIAGRYAAVRAARPATGCDAISRAYLSSGEGRVRSVPGVVGGTALPKMRVKTAKDQRAAWQAVGERILARTPEGKRAALRSLYGPEEACLESGPVTFQSPDDLAFAYTLGHTLSPSLGASARTRNQSQLAEWIPRYEALVRAVDDARTTWSHAFAITQQRGEIAGISLSSTQTHRRTTTLVSAHLAALSQLQQAYPERLRAIDG